MECMGTAPITRAVPNLRQPVGSKRTEGWGPSEASSPLGGCAREGGTE